MSDHDEPETEALSFSIRLLIKHPSCDPSEITRELGLTPHLAHRVGEARQIPKGTPLPGTYRETVWSHAVRVTGERRFLTSADALVSGLEERASFLQHLKETGGTVCLIFDLFGEHNVGDVLRWQSLARLAALRVDLGVEVFS
jgi:hypothetical protein